MGQPAIAEDPRFRTGADRRANDPALKAAIEEVLRGRTASEWEAIFAEADVPAAFADDTPLNKRCMDDADKFKKAVKLDKPQPSPAEIAANKTKWGL